MSSPSSSSSTSTSTTTEEVQFTDVHGYRLMRDKETGMIYIHSYTIRCPVDRVEKAKTQLQSLGYKVAETEEERDIMGIQTAIPLALTRFVTDETGGGRFEPVKDVSQLTVDDLRASILDILASCTQCDKAEGESENAYNKRKVWAFNEARSRFFAHIDKYKNNKNNKNTGTGSPATYYNLSPQAIAALNAITEQDIISGNVKAKIDAIKSSR